MKARKRGRTPIEEAVSMIVEETKGPIETELRALADSAGYVLAGDVRAVLDQPPFTRSPLDGYALRSSDLNGAGREHPVCLPVSQYIPAGIISSGRLPERTAARIMTGAPLPEGADCVIPQEDTDRGEHRAAFYAFIEPGRNVCFKGEDIKAGEILVFAGTRLDFTHIGILAGQGIRRVEVYKKPRVAVMATGDELLPLDKEPVPGKIYDSNGVMICARLRELGAEAVMHPIKGDAPGELAAATERLLQEYPLVITTGGVSVGDRDYMPAVAEMVRARILFHGIAAKPGSPALAAVRNGHILLALSGNPFACIATLELLARPVLAKLSGESVWRQRQVRARLAGSFGKPSPARRFIRARLTGGLVSVPEKGHSSGSLKTLAGCNCLIDIPGGSGALAEGDEVKVWLF